MATRGCLSSMRSARSDAVRSMKSCTRGAHAINLPVLRPQIHRRTITVVGKAAFNPPTVSDTKDKFISSYRRPIPAIFNTVIQELLVQQHFCRYNAAYQYDEILALGVVSAYEQILDDYDATEKSKIFTAYIAALGENADKYRKDAANLETWASNLGGPEGLVPDESGSDIQRILAKVAKNVSEGKFAYSKFFAIGLFRLLELTGAKEPAALEKMIKALGVRADLVNKDLLLYKGILSKLSAAKELFKDFLEREKKKQAEREAAKTASEQPSTEPVQA